MIPNDHLMLWTEIYRGVPGRPRTKLAACGWCALPKRSRFGIVQLEDVQRISKHFHAHGYPANKYCVLSYSEDRCCRKFKASDPIFGVFG